MIGQVLTKFFGSRNDRVLKKIQPMVERINKLEPAMQKLDDAGLAAKTVEFNPDAGVPAYAVPSGVYGVTMYLLVIPFTFWRRRTAERHYSAATSPAA